MNEAALRRMRLRLLRWLRGGFSQAIATLSYCSSATTIDASFLTAVRRRSNSREVSFGPLLISKFLESTASSIF